MNWTYGYTGAMLLPPIGEIGCDIPRISPALVVVRRAAAIAAASERWGCDAALLYGNPDGEAA